MNRYRFLDEKGEHMHTLDGKSLLGTTAILGIISKELTWWASGMACAEFGWVNKKKVANDYDRLEISNPILKKIKNMTALEYLHFLDRAYRAHYEFKEKRSEEGIDLHALVEEYIGLKIKGIEPLFVHEKLKSFVDWCEKNVKRFLFSEIHCYSERLWVGGGCDFGYIDNQNHSIIADIKSREKDYFSDFCQVAGYAIQLKENGGFTNIGDRIFDPGYSFQGYAMFPVTAKFKEPIIKWNILAYEQAFESAVQIYKTKQMYENENGT